MTQTAAPQNATLTLERRVITRPGRSRKNGYAPRTLVVWALVDSAGIAKEYPTRIAAERALAVLGEYL
jgi:hypothetical protein